MKSELTSNSVGAEKSQPKRRLNHWMQLASTALFVIGGVLLVTAANDKGAVASRAGGVRLTQGRELRLKEENQAARKFSVADEVAPLETIGAAVASPTGRKLQTQYYSEAWNNLPQEIQDAFTVMGYTENLWDFGGAVSTNDLDWTELTAEQQEAALFIGFTEEQWCVDEEPVAPASGGTPEELYYDEYWKDLPKEVQDAYAVLGYNETGWNTAIVPESSNEYWDDLSQEMQEAALFIGYTKEAWDGTTGPTASPTPAPVQKIQPSTTAPVEAPVTSAPVEAPVASAPVEALQPETTAPASSDALPTSPTPTPHPVTSAPVGNPQPETNPSHAPSSESNPVPVSSSSNDIAETDADVPESPSDPAPTTRSTSNAFKMTPWVLIPAGCLLLL